MKKILCGLLVVCSLCLVSGCGNKQSEIFKSIELDNSKCKIEDSIDSHGGFHGDGDYFACIECSDIDYNELSKNWKKLPLSESLVKVTEMEQCDDKGCFNIYDKFSIPVVENGYYYFIDRQADSRNKYDDTDLNNRSSWNFSLAIFDIDTDTVYYYELDT